MQLTSRYQKFNFILFYAATFMLVFGAFPRVFAEGYLYVLNYESNTITVIDATTHKILKKNIQTKGNPSALRHVGKNIYAMGSPITHIDGKTFETKPLQLSADKPNFQEVHDGKLYTPDPDFLQILVHDLHTDEAHTNIHLNGVKPPSGAYCAPFHNVVDMFFYDKALWCIESPGGYVSQHCLEKNLLTKRHELGTPKCTSAWEKYLFILQKNGTLKIINMDTAERTSTPTIALEQTYEIYDIAVQRNTLCILRKTGKIDFINWRTGANLGAVQGTWTHPSRAGDTVALVKNRLYIIDKCQNTIHIVDIQKRKIAKHPIKLKKNPNVILYVSHDEEKKSCPSLLDLCLQKVNGAYLFGDNALPTDAFNINKLPAELLDRLCVSEKK